MTILNRVKITIFFSCLLFLVTSCSTIEFRSEGTEQYAISVRPQLTRTEVKEGVCEVYLWGLYPDECIINLQKEFKDYGLVDPSLVIVGQSYSFTNLLWATFTFGIYLPVSYEISVYTKEERR